MDEKLIIESLSPMERGVLPKLSEKFLDIKDVSEKADLDKTTVLRAIGFLENKGLVESESSKKRVVILGILGINYLKKELPERALLNKLADARNSVPSKLGTSSEVPFSSGARNSVPSKLGTSEEVPFSSGKVIPIGEIKNVCGLNDNEAKIALGTLKKKALIEIKQGKLILNAKPEDVTRKMIEEIFMEKLPMDFDDIVDLDKLAFENLKARKDIIEDVDEKSMKVKLTGLGRKIAGMNLDENLLEALTPKILKQNTWKGKKFRRYDLTSPAPRVYGGKRHFVNQAIDYAKSIWLEMGFKEMSGNSVETGFWVFDSLFTAQDHPVREMQDTFYLKGLIGKLPEDKKLIESVKKVHEGGVDGSKGWQYNWNEEDAKKVLLRTHTTCLSARKLMEIGKIREFPAKYFAIGKCFRNETIDWSHGFEFNQTEGIVVDENANFRQLLGYLKQFFGKMGYEKIRIRPAYFAYTEPSLEIDFWHPVHKKWLELGGAGMFRPEVTIPMFGKHIPVLAWGPGFDRIIMEFFGINDLRELNKNDLNKLREMKFWRK